MAPEPASSPKMRGFPARTLTGEPEPVESLRDTVPPRSLRSLLFKSFFLVAADFYCTATPAHPGQDCEFVFVVFAGESFFGHGVGCGNAAAAG